MKPPKNMIQNTYVGLWDVHLFYHFISKHFSIISCIILILIMVIMIYDIRWFNDVKEENNNNGNTGNPIDFVTKRLCHLTRNLMIELY